MAWAEYAIASLDLSDESPIPSSRPYRQGRRSLDDTKLFVRFIRDEQAWPGAIATYEAANEAGPILRGTDYTAPPTAEEVEQERVAVVDYKEQQLLKLAAHKLAQRASGVPMEDTSLAAIKAACLEVQGGGSNAIVDNLVRLYKANQTNTINKVLQTISVLEQRAAQVHALVLAGRRAKDRDEDIQPFIDELRAL